MWMEQVTQQKILPKWWCNAFMIYPGTIRPKITKIAHIQGSWPLEPTHFFEQMGRK